MSRPYESADDIRQRVCGTKRGWPIANDARGHAERLNRDQPGANFGHYRCPFCRRWHVGHPPSVFALEATARVMRGLDPTPPQPHDPPKRERRRRRDRKKETPMSTDTAFAPDQTPVRSLASPWPPPPTTPTPDPVRTAPPSDPIGLIREAIAGFDARRDEIAGHGDWHALAVALVGLKQVAADLKILNDAIERDLYRLLPDKRTEVDGLGVLEKRRGTDRKAWQSIDLLDELLRVAVVDPESGEVLGDETMIRQRIHEVLVEAVPFNPSLGWRVTALRELGIEPDEWCETKPGRESVQIIDNRDAS